eukprot:3709498-Pleurochrysis_carterae.AAC.1
MQQPAERILARSPQKESVLFSAPLSDVMSLEAIFSLDSEQLLLEDESAHESYAGRNSYKDSRRQRFFRPPLEEMQHPTPDFYEVISSYVEPTLPPQSPSPIANSDYQRSTKDRSALSEADALLDLSAVPAFGTSLQVSSMLASIASLRTEADAVLWMHAESGHPTAMHLPPIRGMAAEKVDEMPDVRALLRAVGQPPQGERRESNDSELD